MNIKQEPHPQISGILSADSRIAPKQMHVHRFDHWKKDANGKRYYYCECGQKSSK
jgi:hypothetical protein